MIIVAAGKGLRAGAGGVAKQYRAIAGRPVLAWSLEASLSHPRIDLVLPVIGADAGEAYRTAIAGLESARLLAPAIGGDTRQESVRNGLISLKKEDVSHVLIHDAARPGLDHGLIDRLLAALQGSDGALAALPVNDTLKAGDADNLIARTVERAGLWAAQTPQGFRYDAILAAHEAHAGDSVTDDAALAELAGIPVRLVPGSLRNMKITRAEDFAIMERLLSDTRYEYRTGQGFDVHAFTEGDHVTLCGVAIPHTHALHGHSDADAGMHALTDALFGAIGAGDIGDHFPPADPQWKDAASEIFLRKAAAEIAARGGAIVHCDITLICERPKIGPHRQAMRTALASILAIAPERVSIKATTSEGLGFTGRGDGIAAMATASVRLPEGA